MKLKVYILDTRKISLDILLSSPYVSKEESLLFDKYKNEEVKKEKIASLILKNKYIGQYYLSEQGKPLSKDKYFNISHSHGLVTLVIDSLPIGIDIELIREVDNKLISYISNEEEERYIKDNQSFFEVWTNKEALMKCIGIGINQKPNNIPGLPVNSKRIYQGQVYFNKTVIYDNFVIAISRNKDEDYSLEIIKE